MRIVVGIIFAIWLAILGGICGGYLGGPGAAILAVVGAALALYGLRKRASSKLVAHRGFFWTIIGSILLPICAAVFAGNQTKASGNDAATAVGSGIGVAIIAVIAFFCFIVALVGWFMTRGPKPGDYKACPRCAENVKSEAMVCRHCGHEFTELAPAPA